MDIAAGASLAAIPNLDAINSAIAFTLNNFGTISGAGTSQGIDTIGGATAINNSNLISGPNGAIRFTTAGGTVTNLASGTIDGNTGVLSDGVQGFNGVTVNNSGTITGINNGINALGALQSTINNTGGSITGGNQGITAANLLTLTNNAAINGTLFNGVNAGTNATITNTGSITGNIDGIQAGNGGNVTNSGAISGTTGDGIDVSGLLLTNTFSLTNSGLLQGATNAFNGGLSNDTLNLNAGSRVIGNVSGGAGGLDIINFGAALSAPGVNGNSISGNITNFDQINKTGGGVALIGLPGEGLVNVNADVINVGAGGGLYINGNINAADGVSQATFTSNGVAIGGTGVWNANININSGGISAGAIPINLDVNPTNAVGNVAITGNVVHAPGSFIRFDVNPQGGGSDLITQTGLGNTYDVNGANLRIASTDNNRAISNGSYVVVDSAAAIANFPSGGVITSQLNPNVNAGDTGIRGSEIVVGGGATNNNTTVLSQNFSTLSLTDGGTNLVLNINHDFSSLATNPNAVAIGNALDASINSPNANIQDFIGALDNSNLAAVQATLNGLSPDATFATTVALASGNYRLHRLVQDHLALTRAGGDSVRSYVGSYSEPASAPAPQVQNAGRGNVWGNVSYAWKDIDSNFGNDFDGEEASFTAGFDYRISQDFLIGLVLDGSTADYDYTGGGSDVDSFRAAIYGTYGQPTGVYADFLAGYGSHDIGLNRNGGILAGINSDTNADSLQAMLTVGYAMQSGCVKHGPFAGLEYQNIDVDGYTQGGPLPIAVSGYDVDSLRLLAGYRVEASYGRLSPFASVAYAHEFEDDAINATAVLPGGAGFGATGSGLESALLISIGANYALTSDLTLTGGYLGELSVGGDGTDSHGASIGLNYAF